MTKDINKISKIILIICAVVLTIAVSSSLIYYYVYFRPANERAKWQAELEWEKEKQARQERKEALEEYEKKIKKAELDSCLDRAYENYQKMWDDECKRLGYKPGSALPKDIADNLNEYYENDKEDCYKLYGLD